MLSKILLTCIISLVFCEPPSKEMCEIGCEESELNRYLHECRNACNVNSIDDNGNKSDFIHQYLFCMHDICLMNGKGPTDLILGDDMWIECSKKCDRDKLIKAHEATQKPLDHTQYLSEKQYENFKWFQILEYNKFFGNKK